MTVYLGKERKCASPLMTATDDSLTRPSTRNENVGHKFYMDQSSPCLFDGSCTNRVRMLKPKREGMLKSIGQRMKVNCSNLENRVRGNLSPLVGKVK
jgi:hypothetical protein